MAKKRRRIIMAWQEEAGSGASLNGAALSASVIANGMYRVAKAWRGVSESAQQYVANSVAAAA